MRFTGCVVAVLVVALLAGPALADRVTDAMASASSAYGQGEYKAAREHLQTALAAVNRKLLDRLIEALPAAPAGWTADDPEGIDAASMGAGFFATLVVERVYHPPSGSAITLTVSANSPMLVSLKMFLSSAMLASMSEQTGMKKVSACGHDAIEHFGEGTYEAHVLGDATLISFRGASEGDIGNIRTVMNATDCKAIMGVIE